MTCIYCPSTGPFTDEHVIPAGLGGDDKNWLLKSIVCGDCNTMVFSPLEVKVMRSSPLAIARLFLQSRSRNRGGKTTAPSIQAPVSYFDDPETGLLLEQELRSGGKPTIFPQVIVAPPNQVTVAATDMRGANKLVGELGSLADQLTICVKERDGPDVHFHLTPLTWLENGYLVGEAARQSKAPHDAIWLEPLERPATNPTSVLTPRVFRRTNGPLVCRAGSIDDAARLLTFIRANHSGLVVPAETPATITNTPRIHFRQLMDLAAYDRVLTKIGVNLCAHLFDAEAVRTSAFNAAREYARTGVGSVRKWPNEVAQAHSDRFPRLPHHHLIVVTANPPRAGQAGHVVVLMQFYGGLVQAFIVAEGDTGIPTCPDPIFVVVDYKTNKISKFSIEDFVTFAITCQTSMPFIERGLSGSA